MTWPFENDTGAIVKKLAKRSLAGEKRRNLMVVAAVALAAFLFGVVNLINTTLSTRWPGSGRTASCAPSA